MSTDAYTDLFPSESAEHQAADEIFSLSVVDQSAARNVADSILSRTRQTPPSVRSVANLVLACTAWSNGEVSRGIAYTDDAIEAAEPAMHSWRARGLLGKACMMGTYDVPGSRQVLQSAVRELGHCDLAMHAVVPLVEQARLESRNGQSATAAGLATHAVSLARRFGNTEFHLSALSVAASTTARIGNWAATAELLKEYSEITGGDTASYLSAPVEWARLQVSSHTDNSSPSILGELSCKTNTFVSETGAAGWLTRRALELGYLSVARSVLHTTTHLARNNPQFPRSAAMADHAAALINRDSALLISVLDRYTDHWAKGLAAEDLLHMHGINTHDGQRYAKLAVDYFTLAGAHPDRERVQRLLLQEQTQLNDVQAHEESALSDREKQIFDLICLGRTNRQIAGELFISPHTVNYHLRKIYRRMNVRSRVELLSLHRLGA